MMDRELTEAFKDVKLAVNTGHARLEAKLDLVNEQFNKHLVDDAKMFTKLEIGQQGIETKIEAEGRRRKEESERVQRVQAEEKQKGDQLKWLKTAGWWAIAAALAGSFASSALTYIEQRSAREERIKARAEENVKPR